MGRCWATVAVVAVALAGCAGSSAHKPPSDERTGVMPAGGEGASLGGMLNYFADHQERLGYALRLRRGQSIGSGTVEGSIKQLLNRRLKQTGARWKKRHVGPFVELCALAESPEWNAFWSTN